MMTIWKSLLKPTDIQSIEVPIGAELLFAREQFEHIAIWYRCDSLAKKERRDIIIVGTGHIAPSMQEGRYLGSAALFKGELIFHVFERI